MPPDGTSNSSSLGQLSLRHIPDISETLSEDVSIMSCNQSSMQLDTSFSIHISGVGSNTLLADEDAENFFGGTDADMSIEEDKPSQRTKIQQIPKDEEYTSRDATPRASAAKSKPTLVLELRSELEVESVSSIPFPSPPFKKPTRAGSPVEDSFAIIPSATSPASPQPCRQDEPVAYDEYQATSKLRSPKIKQPQEIGRTSLQTTAPSVEVSQPSRDKPALRNKQKVIEGGIIKSKLPAKKTTSTSKDVTLVAKPEARSKGPFTRQASKPPSKPSLPKVPPKDDDLHSVDAPSFADASSSSIIPQGGVAARLMQYGKKYMANVEPTLTPDASLLADIDEPMDPQPLPCSELREAEFPSTNPPVELETPTFSNATTPEPVSTQDESLNDTSLLSSARPSSSSDPVFSIPQQSRTIDEEMDRSIPEDDREGPLTLSQLSPRKRAAAMMSKRSSSRKRVFTTDEEPEENVRSETATIEEGPKMKKSKNNDSTSRETRKVGLTSRPRVPSSRAATSAAAGPSRTRARSGTVSGPRKVVNMSGSGSSAASNTSMKPIAEATTTVEAGDSMLPAAVSELGTRPPRREIRKNRRVVSASSVHSEKKPASRMVGPAFNPAVGWNDDVQLKKVDEEKESRRLKDSRSVNDEVSTSSSMDDKAKARPMTRSQSHTRSQSQNVRLGNYHPAPNFKAIHEAFNESLASRKATFHPTVPVEMQWETDARMEQRRKFDELVREKEREKERLEEEMRKKREEEEEREVRELRKKLVVKAHEVPEWYRDVPRKAKEEVGGV